MKNSDLFAKNAVFISEEKSKEKVLKNVYQGLLKDGYVKGGFFEHIYQRENTYPTGLNLAAISAALPSIAVAHTEGQFVKKSLIVPVKLKNPVEFGNMVNPAQDISVKFIFMLLETSPNGQAKLLSKVMEFLAKTPVDKLMKFFQLETIDGIYQFLLDNF